MPLTFDLPYEKLSSWTGRNPCPENLSSYWALALEELERVPSRAELIPSPEKAPSFAEYFDLWFDGTGGSRIHAKVVRPFKRAGRGPALLQFHGYTGNCGDWQSKLGWAAMGFTVAALDCRGQGGLSEDRGGVAGNTLNGHIIRGLDEAIGGKPEALLYRSIFLDTVRLARLVMEMDGVDPGRIGATGWSQGGALTLACAALEPRLARIAPVYPFLSDYQRVWEMDLARDAYAELREWFRRFDPLHERETEVFTALGYIDNQHLASRIRAETLMGVGLMDTICPPSTQFAAYNRITAKKSLAVYPDFGHEDLPGLHDRILSFMSALQ